MKKILFITNTHSNGGGAENVLTTLVNNLDTNLYAINIIEVNQFLTKREPLNENIQLLAPMVKANDKMADEAIRYVLYHKPEIIKPLFRLYGYDVIITWNDQQPSFCLFSFEAEIKIAWFHGTIYYLQPNLMSPKSIEKYKLQLKAWNTANQIITISKKTFKSLEDIFPALSYKTKIIYNAFDVSYVQRFSEYNIDIKTPDSNNIIIGIGRLDSNKNFELLIRAVSRVIHFGINCHLIIIGHGELFSQLEEIAVEANIKDFVLFTKYLQNPYPLLKISKLVCVSSFSEGWPMVIAEGMSLGKPFVTTPVAGASEELSNNGRCGLVSGWDVEEYANCIIKLLNDQNLYNEMSKNCIERIHDFSMEQTLVQFDSLIEKLCSANNTKITIEKTIKRPYAIIFYALAFSLFAPFYRFTLALQYFKKKHTFLNIIKLLYRLGTFVLYAVFFPVNFSKGLMRTARNGK